MIREVDDHEVDIRRTFSMTAKKVIVCYALLRSTLIRESKLIGA